MGAACHEVAVGADGRYNDRPALALQAQQAAMRRVGRGGLGEDEDFASAEARAGSSGGNGSRRGEQTTGVAYADVVHHPSEAEQILKLLAAQLRCLRRLPVAAGEPVCACMRCSVNGRSGSVVASGTDVQPCYDKYGPWV